MRYATLILRWCAGLGFFVSASHYHFLRVEYTNVIQGMSYSFINTRFAPEFAAKDPANGDSDNKKMDLQQRMPSAAAAIGVVQGLRV